MNLKACPQCKTNVLPTASDVCPSCSCDLKDIAPVEISMDAEPKERPRLLRPRLQRSARVGLVAASLVLVSLVLPWISKSAYIRKDVTWIPSAFDGRLLPDVHDTWVPPKHVVGIATPVGAIAFVLTAIFILLMATKGSRAKPIIVVISIILGVLVVQSIVNGKSSVGCGLYMAAGCTIVACGSALMLRRD